MQSKIIITDLHGSYLTMLALIEQFPKDIPIVCCGDNIDHGPRSMQVVQYMIDNNIPTVKGNHEDMMVRSFSCDSSMRGIWENNGGLETLSSYNDENGKRDEKKLLEHIAWMEKLPLYLEFKDAVNDKGDYLVVSHSSIGAVWKWDKERRESMSKQFENTVMWGRKAPKIAKGIYNVIGHTPHTIFDPRIKSFYANIDTGCCFNSEEHKIQGYGVLTALQFPEMKIYQQENID